jgi:hypothetical protein
MKYVKMLGLVTVAMVAVFAFVGAGSASATVLCEANEDPCAVPLPSGTVLKGETEEAGTYEGGELKGKCNSSFVAKTTSNGGKEKTVTAEITSLTFSSCTGSCATVKAANLPYAASMEATGEGNGKMTVEKGSGGGEPAVDLTCGGESPCRYGAPTETWKLEGGHPAHLRREVRRKKIFGPASCAIELIEVYRYRLTFPTWLWWPFW